MQDFYNVLLKNDLLKDAVIISFILDDLKELHDIDPTLNMWYLVNYLDSKTLKPRETQAATVWTSRRNLTPAVRSGYARFMTTVLKPPAGRLTTEKCSPQ